VFAILLPEALLALFVKGFVTHNYRLMGAIGEIPKEGVAAWAAFLVAS